MADDVVNDHGETSWSTLRLAIDVASRRFLGREGDADDRHDPELAAEVAEALRWPCGMARGASAVTAEALQAIFERGTRYR